MGKKRNRRRSIKTPPTASKLSPKDRPDAGPTVFALAHKARILNTPIQAGSTGVPRLAKHGEALAHDPLVYYAHTGFITENQKRAGDLYGWLRWRLFGHAVAAGGVLGRLASEHLDDRSPSVRASKGHREPCYTWCGAAKCTCGMTEDMDRMEVYEAADKCLRSSTSVQTRLILRRVAVDLDWPETWPDMLRLRHALMILARHWRMEG